MSVLIRLATPIQATPAARRPAYFVGRSLTASDFGRNDAYIDDRFAALRPAAPGAVWGLGVALDASGANITVSGGLGVGFAGPPIRLAIPLTVAWADLVKKAAGQNVADGLYLLLARAVDYDGLIGPPPDQVLLSSGDPMLDLTQLTFVEVLLSAQVGSSPAGAGAADRALAFNLFTGGLDWDSLSQAAQGGLPLAALLVQTVGGAQNLILNGPAGRLPAEPAPLNAMLLAQTRQALADALAEPGADPTSASWQSGIRARFRYLPAAGELPVGMFSDSAAPAFFPLGMAVYLELIRASQAQKFLADSAHRPGLDLASGDAEAATLALAVPDALWSRDLIDHSRADPVMAADLHLAYARARRAQADARAAWIALYGGLEDWIKSQPQALAFLIDSDGAGQNLSNLLNFASLPIADVTQTADSADQPNQVLAWATDKITRIGAAATVAAAAAAAVHQWQAAVANNQTPLPPRPAPAQPAPPAPVPAAPPDPDTAFFALGYQIADPEPPSADPTQANHTPAKSDDLLAPLKPYLPQDSEFVPWETAINGAVFDADLMQPLIDAGLFGADTDAATRQAAIANLLALPADSIQPGSLAVLASLQLFYAVLVRAVAEQARRLATLNNMLALQRQHLDMMSVYISGLAGGIPTDGSGMAVTRALPFFKLDPPSSGDVKTEPTNPVASVSAGTYVNLQRFTSFQPGTIVGKPQRFLMSLSARASATMATIAPNAATTASALTNSVAYSTSVAAQTTALAQGPQFQINTASYGVASHITSGATLNQFASSGLNALQDLMESQLVVARTAAAVTAPSGASAEALSYANTTAYARALLADIASVEASAQVAESAYLLMRDRLNSLEARISQAASAAAAAQDALRAALAQASTSAGDYAAAQKLAQDELARVLAAVAARQQAIDAAAGLFYRRELQTLVTTAPISGLSLLGDPTAAEPDFSGAPAPPAALQPFIALIEEAPLNDWIPLRDRWIDLPDFDGLARLASFRKARLANWSLPAPAVASVAASDFQGLIDDTRSAFQPMFTATWQVSGSLAAAQAAAFKILSPRDIGILSLSALRAKADDLRTKLEQASGALYAAIAALPPATRFDLAARARGKTLTLLQFAQWPLPSTLDAPAAATARRLAAIVGWISAQADTASSSAGLSALANLVAASVMIAAYSDPNEAVSGTLASTGAPPRPGWPLRGVLNGRPAIGSTMDLYDDKQSLVGVLRVEDHDTTGTTFSVVSAFSTATPNSGWSIQSRGRIARLPS